MQYQPSPNDETDDTVDASSSSPKKKLKADNDDDATGIVPTDNDVLLGRGAFINDHSGNRLFRTLALEHKAEFDAGNATEKREISTKVVQLTKGTDGMSYPDCLTIIPPCDAATNMSPINVIMCTMSLDRTPPGRFLKRASSAVQSPICLPDGNYELPPRGLEGPWEEVPEEQAFAKAMQTLRDLKKKVPTATTSETMTPEETQNELAV